MPPIVLHFELLRWTWAMMRPSWKNLEIGCPFMFSMDIQQLQLTVVCSLLFREILSGKSSFCLAAGISPVFVSWGWPDSWCCSVCHYFLIHKFCGFFDVKCELSSYPSRNFHIGWVVRLNSHWQSPEILVSNPASFRWTPEFPRRISSTVQSYTVTLSRIWGEIVLSCCPGAVGNLAPLNDPDSSPNPLFQKR
jgi:hypothetical protein